jgi:hypothetical protein
MAKKPRSQWSPGYRKRIETRERKLRAEARAAGRSVTAAELRQRARGHRPAEHITRAEHEAERLAVLGGLTQSQRKSIRQFAREQAGKIRQYQDNRDALIAPMLEWATAAGWDAFVAMRAAQRSARREYNAAVAEGSYESAGGGALDLIAAEHGVPDPRWMYYHT